MKLIFQTGALLLLFTTITMTTHAQSAYKNNPKLTNVSSTVVINKSIKEVWHTLYEKYGNVSLYHPQIESSIGIDNTLHGGKGAQRQCNINDKKYLKESIIEVEEEKRFVIELDEAKGVPFDQAYAEYQLISLADNQTKVIQTAYYKTKPAFMGKMMKGKMGKDLSGVIIGRKYYLETGGTVDKEGYKKISKVYKKMDFSGTFSKKI